MREVLKKETWDQDIQELEDIFRIAQLPSAPIQLDGYSRIVDVTLFINSHMNIVKSKNGNMRYKPYLDRLIELKNYILNNLH